MADVIVSTFVEHCSQTKKDLEKVKEVKIEDIYQFISTGFSQAIEKVLFSNQIEGVVVDII